MDASRTEASGPDFSRGVPIADAPGQGVLAGHVGGEPVLLARRADGFWAVSATCTHYGGPLTEGLAVGDTVRCPWHHACFDLRSGEALTAPAISPLDRWRVEIEGDLVFVRTREAAPLPAAPAQGDHPGRIVIVGGGAAGFAAAEMLRRRGYHGVLTLLSADSEPPCDRPNLSKDYLAGTAPEDWIPLKPTAFYADHDIDLRLGFEVARLDLEAKQAIGVSGERIGYDALLLATGAEPIRLKTPGFDRENVHVLRSLADARTIIAAADRARRVVIVGASFIGLEAAASLRTRGLEVHVVAPEAMPLERIMGPDLGAFVRSLHESRGVRFHLGTTAVSFDGEAVTLADGARLDADFVVLGVGVRPRLQLAVDAGLAVDGGVIVDRGMRASHPGIYAAGDIACYPGPTADEGLRIEHWVVAERQGQVAALNMLGETRELTDAPFFWSQHYDQAIRYVGHARAWDAVRIDGSIPQADATVRFEAADRLLAAATLGRDLESLRIGEELRG
ncbi:pyridine nucleotide-disulfide oxidoreductase [Brevundimonas naejangsanensis]|uniref:Pyridine nucleotide-disulfide oxidoreductase n=1 Tax=Brevundimonas naejangsanensis TaxID=588932 RepID=A0A494RK89_9CAUL|nr:FAD-dependent oxidoreductase [Brevundimonas naejangsanensis]AYG95889.1 pyridine nucleotide-disulfide oxidoreductase [Brevundimonas naejangsanensis]